MTEQKPRNTGPKRRVRAYAANHDLTYQQAFQQLHNNDLPARRGRNDLAVPIGAEVEIHRDRGRRASGVGYRIGAEQLWTPFADDTSACAFIAPHDTMCVGSLCHQITENGILPLDSVLAVTGDELACTTETSWIPAGGDEGRWRFQQVVMNNHSTGYAQAAVAADAIANFRPQPGRLGIVILQLSDPYPPYTEADIQEGREWHKTEAEWEEWAKSQRLITRPFWEEETFTDHPDGRTTSSYLNHELTEDDQRSYERFLAEVDRLLHRASRDGIVVLASADFAGAVPRLLDRMGLRNFGARFFNAVHFEYSDKPAVDQPELFAQLFPFCDGIPDLPAADDRYFWAGGMEPKQGRVAYASFAGLESRPTLMLFKDPPVVPDYWLSSYEWMAQNQPWD